MWEILSGMPLSGKHLLGNLAVGADRLVYYAEPIDFAAYGGSTKEELERLDRESGEYMNEVFSELLEREKIYGSKKRKVLGLIGRYMSYHGAGTLAEHAQELQEDPSYELMLKGLWDYNYGPWMKATIETTKYNAGELEIFW